METPDTAKELPANLRASARPYQGIWADFDLCNNALQVYDINLLSKSALVGGPALSTSVSVRRRKWRQEGEDEFGRSAFLKASSKGVQLNEREREWSLKSNDELRTAKETLEQFSEGDRRIIEAELRSRGRFSEQDRTARRRRASFSSWIGVGVAVAIVIIGLMLVRPGGRDQGSPTNINELVRRLTEDQRMTVQRERIEDLSRVGAPAIPALIAALHERYTNENAAVAIGLTLARIGGAAVPAVTTLLGDDEWGVRHIGVTIVGEIGEPAKSTIPILVEMVRDQSQRPEVRDGATDALAELGRVAVPELRELLLDDDPLIRSAALIAFTKIGPPGRDAVPDLIGILNEDYFEDGSVYVSNRMMAISALAAIGPDAMDAQAELSRLLTDDDNLIRGNAAYALGQISGDCPYQKLHRI